MNGTAERASAITVVTLYNTSHEGSGLPEVKGPNAIAEFHDTFERTGSGWKIAHRRGVPILMINTCLPEPPHSSLVRFRRTQHDQRSDRRPQNHADDMLTFLTYDDEHHRFAFGKMPDSFADANPESIGLAHFAYSYASIDDLIDTYERLKAEGILPFWPNKHGLTTSLYYKDPDGNEIELQTDNFATQEECKAYFKTEAYTSNPIGNAFGPDVFIKGYRSGRSFDEAMGEAVQAAATETV